MEKSGGYNINVVDYSRFTLDYSKLYELIMKKILVVQKLHIYTVQSALM